MFPPSGDVPHTSRPLLLLSTRGPAQQSTREILCSRTVFVKIRRMGCPENTEGRAGQGWPQCGPLVLGLQGKGGLGQQNLGITAECTGGVWGTWHILGDPAGSPGGAHSRSLCSLSSPVCLGVPLPTSTRDQERVHTGPPPGAQAGLGEVGGSLKGQTEEATLFAISHPLLPLSPWGARDPDTGHVHLSASHPHPGCVPGSLLPLK